MYKEKISKEQHYANRDQFMTSEEMKEVHDRISTLLVNVGEMQELYTRWSDEDESYRGDQPKKSRRPNTRVNIMHAIIEGQMAGIVDQNIAITTRGEGPSDQSYAEWARIGLDWTLRKNYIKKVLDVFCRRWLKFGTGILKAYFDADAIGGFGLSKICCVPNNRFFVDTKVKDPLRFQEAEYICEPIRMSRTQFEEMYGEEKAACVLYGQYEIEDTTVFQEKQTTDDDNAATLLQWWERKKGKLRLLEFTADGLLLYDSHKEGTRKDNQKKSKETHESYYTYVNDKYPYFFISLYPEEGKLWGFGDGKLMQPLQELLNDLYDKIRICARPNLILFDPNSEVDLEDFDDNSLAPRPANLTTNKAVETVPWGTVNESWWRLLSSIHQEIQRVTRFSYLMLGQKATSETATEASIQQQQGNSGMDYKKSLVQTSLIELCEYVLGLMMEFYVEEKAFRISEDKDEFEWINFNSLAEVPVTKPATQGYIDKFRKENPEAGTPLWELVEQDGNPMTKSVDLDIEINIGAGLPKNKTFLWQMIQQLSQLVSLDAMGNSRPVLHYEELREFLKKFLGIPLQDESEMQQVMQQPMPMDGGQPQAQMPTQNADANLTANGSPITSNLPGNVGGMFNGYNNPT